MRDPPSGRVPEQGPDWFLVATEACGGGTPDLGYFLEVSIFIGIFGIGNKSGGSPNRPRDRAACPGGRARPHPRGQVEAPLAYFFRSIFFIISKNNFRGVSGLLELCRIGL